MRRALIACLALPLVAPMLAGQGTPKSTSVPGPVIQTRGDVTDAFRTNDALVRSLGNALPPPPFSNTRWMRGLNLTPSQLKAGRTARFTPDALQNSDGYLTLMHTTLLRGRANRYIAYADRGEGVVMVQFEAQPGRRYLVAFAVLAGNAGGVSLSFDVRVRSCGSLTQRLDYQDGYVAFVLSRAGSHRCEVSLERVGTTGWEFFSVEVTAVP